VGRTGRLRYRHLRRTVIAVSVALAVVVLLVLSLWRVLESVGVRSFAARRLERMAETVAGVDLEIGDLGWRLVPPRVILSRVRLEGGGIRAEVDWAAVEPGGFFVARPAIVLDTVEARGIRVILVEAPKIEPTSGETPVRIVVRHLDLKGIDIEGLGLPGGFGLKIDGGDISWLQDRSVIRGFTSIEKVALVVPGVAPVTLGVDATFRRHRRGLEMPTVRLYGDDLGIEGAVTWTGPAVLGHIQVRLGPHELDRIIKTKGLLEGSIAIDVDIDTQREAIAKAQLTSDRIVVGGFPVEELKASLQVGSGGLEAQVDTARLFGGRLEGRYRLGRLSIPFPHEVEASCRGLDLANLLENLGVPTGGLSSKVDIATEVAWNSDQFPKGNGNATVDLRGVEGPLPVTGFLALELSSKGLLQFDADDLTIGSSNVSLEGPLMVGSWAPEWGIHVEPAQLTEILPAVNQWVGAEVFPAGVSGHGRIDVGLSGPWKQLTVGVRMDVEEVGYEPMMLNRLVMDASIGGGECRLKDGHYRLASGGGQITGAIRWVSQSGNDLLDLQINGHQLPLDVVASWINLPPGLVSGEAGFAGGLRGDLDDSRGSWALGLTDVEVSGTKIGSGSATVNLRNGAFTASGVEFDRGLTGQIRWDLEADRLTGEGQWHQMELDVMPESLRRVLGEIFDWEASFDWPLAETLPMGIVEIAGEESHLRASLDPSGLTVSGKVEGVMSAEMKAALDKDGSSWSGVGRLQIEAVDALGSHLAPNFSPLMTGSLRIPLRVWGDGGRIFGIEGAIEDSGLRVGDQPAEILKDKGFRWDSKGFSLGGLEIDVGGDQVFQVFVRGGLDAQGQLTGNVSGVFDARLLRIFLPAWEPAGRATGTVEILGDLGKPQLEGIARIERGSFRLPGTRSVVGDVDGVLFLSAGEVAMEDLSFKFMRGRGRGRGRIRVDGGEAHLRLDGTIKGLDFPLFPDFVPRIKGEWALEGSVDDLELSGDLVVTRAEVRRQDDLPSLLMDWFGDVRPSEKDGLRLDLHVRADQNLVSRSPFVRLVGSADLNITGTDAHPGLVGNIEFMEGGEFTLQGIRYELERGQISFSDPTGIDPMLDFQARAGIREYEVWLSLTGTVDRLVPTVSSDPPLNPAEIYSLMALGQVGRSDPGGAVGLTLASTLLTRRMNEVLGSRDQWLLPVDQIRVDPFIESGTGDPSARVTVVKQLSPSVTVTLQSDLSGAKDQIISARWYLGSGLFIEASHDSSNSDGSYGIDFKMRRRY